jgi:hypothetical protein
MSIFHLATKSDLEALEQRLTAEVERMYNQMNRIANRMIVTMIMVGVLIAVAQFIPHR